MIRFTKVKTLKHILSFLFIGIYCAIVFHNVVPHIHTGSSPETDPHITVHASHDHGDHEHHHPHQQNEEESSWIDFILGLIGDVQHTDLGDDHFENFTSQTTIISVASFDFTSTDIPPYHETSDALIVQKRVQNHIGHPKILYEQYNTCSRPLRGPPSIS